MLACLALLWAASLSACASEALDAHECFVIHGAVLAPLAGDTDIDRLLGIHRVESGPGVVIAIRDYRVRSLSRSDAREFRKITVALPRSPSESIDLAGPEVKVRYTRGNSVFVGRGAGQIAMGAVGRMTVMPHYGDVQVRIEATVPTEPTSRDAGGDVVHLDEVYRCGNLDLAQVTPWIGKAGSGPSEEANAWHGPWALLRNLVRRDARITANR